VHIATQYNTHLFNNEYTELDEHLVVNSPNNTDNCFNGHFPGQPR